MNCRTASLLLIWVLIPFSIAAADDWSEIDLVNPSFEKGEAFPDGWVLLKGNTIRRSHPSVIAWDKEFARTGERSIYIGKEDIGPIRCRSTQSIPVTPATIYRLQFWVRTTGIGNHATASLTASSSVSGPDGKPWSVTKGFAAGDTPNLEWQNLMLEFTPPDWVKNLTISFSNSTGGRDGRSIEFWFDDISLQQKPETKTSTESE